MRAQVEAVDSEQEELKRQAAVLRRDMGAELAGAHPPNPCIPSSYDGGVPCQAVREAAAASSRRKVGGWLAGEQNRSTTLDLQNVVIKTCRPLWTY